MQDIGAVDADVPVLQSLWVSCGSIAAQESRRVGNMSTMDVTVAVMLAKRKRETHASAAHTEVHHSELGARVGAPGHRASGKLERSRFLEGDPRAREKREAATREHWLEELRGLVQASLLPIVTVAATASDPAGVPHCAAGF